jgi:hypothetical protein
MSKNGGWQRKLIDKEKARVLKLKKGNEMPIMGYCQKARPMTARKLERLTVEDKPAPKPVPTMQEVKATDGKVLRKFNAPMRSGFTPRGYDGLKMNRSERRARERQMAAAFEVYPAR